MAKLISDWFKVATAGRTIDDRVIKEQWLFDAAENYDPAEYTALIFPEHYRYMNLGSVAALKTGKDAKQRTCLFAKLQPNDALLSMKASGQKLFMSIEIKENYLGNGKSYLSGIAATDSPASVGTDRLQFSRKTDGTVLSALEEVGNFTLPADNTFFNTVRNWIKPEFLRALPSIDEQPNAEETHDMSAELLNDIVARLDAQNKKIEAQFASLEQTLATQTSAKTPADTTPDTFSLAEGVALKTELAELHEKFAALSAEFSALRATPVGETKTPENTGTSRNVY
jgi:hypothetical protein